mgnify:CR=1 FL=1
MTISATPSAAGSARERGRGGGPQGCGVLYGTQVAGQTQYIRRFHAGFGQRALQLRDGVLRVVRRDERDAVRIDGLTIRHHGFDHHLLQLRAGEPCGAVYHHLQGEPVLRSPPLQLQIEDGAPLGRVGQVEQKDLIETPFAQQFAGQPLHAVGGGHHEHGAALLGHPGEQAGQHPLAGAAITTARAAGREAKTLVDLVDPQDGRGNTIGHGDGPADVFLGRTDEAPEHPPHVEPQQWQLPGGGDGLGAQALAASLDAEQQHLLRFVTQCRLVAVLSTADDIHRAARRKGIDEGNGLAGGWPGLRPGRTCSQQHSDSSQKDGGNFFSQHEIFPQMFWNI